MENRRASRYMGFDAWKGLKETVVEADEFTTKKKYPNLSEEQRRDMDVTLYHVYNRKKDVRISYIYKGVISSIYGKITKIDFVSHMIYINGKDKIYLAQIVDLCME